MIEASVYTWRSIDWDSYQVALCAVDLAGQMGRQLGADVWVDARVCA